MASTGNLFPGTGENNAGIGATAWTNPGNIVSDNATDATCNAAASSQYLVARNFSFSSIPTNATIRGITVRIEGTENTAGTESVNAQLQNDSGALIGSSKAQTFSGTGATVYTYGASNDLWGATITRAMLQDADFGVRFWFTTAHNITVDYVTMAIEWDIPADQQTDSDPSTKDPRTMDGRRLRAGDVLGSLLLTTLIASNPASTDVTRGPLYQAQKIQPQVVATQQHNLLTSTLADAAPVVAPFVPPVHAAPAWLPRINGETSQGRALPAEAPVAAPFVPPPHAGPALPSRILGETSQGLPYTLRTYVPPVASTDVTRGALVQGVKRPPQVLARQQHNVTATLPTAAVVPPFIPAPHIAPVRPVRVNSDTNLPNPLRIVPNTQPVASVQWLESAPHRVREVSNTSKSTPQTLLVVAVVPPFVPAVHSAPVRAQWLPASTARGTPKTLTADAQLPLRTLHHTPPDRVRPVADTSEGTALVLRVAPIPPFVPPPHLGPHRFPWLPADTTQDVAKTLTADAVPPHKNPQIFAPDRVRPVRDTSQGTGLGLRAAVVPPFVPPQHLAPLRVKWLPTDSTKGTPKPLIADGVAPFSLPQRFQPDRVRPVVDTSQSTGLGLRSVVIVVPPIVPPAHFAPARLIFQPTDSTRGSAKVLSADAVPPFRQSDWPAPQEYERAQYTTRWTQNLPPDYIVTIPVLPFVSVGGGRGRFGGGSLTPPGHRVGGSTLVPSGSQIGGETLRPDNGRIGTEEP
jgi:hypothetical protein